MSVVPVSRPPESGHACSAQGAEVVERVEAFVDTRDGDPPLEVVEVVGNDEVVGNRVAGAEGAEGLNCELSLRLLLSRGMRG
jgi:hypothetical protein